MWNQGFRMRMWIQTAVIILAGLARCSESTSLASQFHMSGVRGQATLTWAEETLTVTLQMEQAVSNPSTIEIRPLWVDYNREEKCTSEALGDVIDGMSTTATLTTSPVTTTVTFANVTSLEQVEGNSLVIRTQDKVVCATIQKDTDHVTAYAKFIGPIFGHVTLRQAENRDGGTRLVVDLATRTDVSVSDWRITDSYTTCAEYMRQVLTNIYSPGTPAPGECGLNNHGACAVGDLSSKLGRLTVASQLGTASGKRGYTDSNLPLTGDHTVLGRLMILFPEGYDVKPVCGKIYSYPTRTAVAKFSHDGVKGEVKFTQRSPLDPTTTEVNLEGLAGKAGGYHVHKWPVPERLLPSQGGMCAPGVVSGHFNPFVAVVGTPSSATYPAVRASTTDMYEVGDLSAKYGLLNGLQTKVATYKDWNLPLFGQYSIVGRSLVIHNNDETKSRWVCTNIEPQYEVISARATFKYPVIGHVTFVQGLDFPGSETSMFVSLDYNDHHADTTGHAWMVGTMALSDDMMSEDESTRCQSAGPAYNPARIWPGYSETDYDQACRDNGPVACKPGDLFRQLGKLDIGYSAGVGDKSKKTYMTATGISLSGPHSIVLRPLVIKTVEGSASLSCALIRPVHPVTLEAEVTEGRVTGKVTFTQTVGHGARLTKVKAELSGMTEGDRLMIHELPPLDGDSTCSDLGMTYDPLSIGDLSPSSTTDDKYKVGDLSRHGSTAQWSSFNLPLAGLNSIKGRSLAVVSGEGSVEGCARVNMSGRWSLAEALATFVGEINGTIHLYQHIHKDGSMTDTTLLVNLEYSNSSEISLQHNWHTHQKLITGDPQSVPGVCDSTAAHYNPFRVDVTKPLYNEECSPLTPLRCELGDQVGKTMPYDIGGGRKLFTDVDLPLVGEFTVLGRSFIIHGENKARARMTCADIKPVTSNSIQIFFSTPSSFAGMDMSTKSEKVTKTYTDAIRAHHGELIVVLGESTGQEIEATVHFVGPRSSLLKSRFLTFIADEDRRDQLGDYVPSLNTAGVKRFNVLIVLGTLVTSLLSSLVV